MRVLGAVVQIPMLPVSNTRHHDSFRGPIATQLIGNDHARTPPGCAQQLTEEPHRRESVTLWLDENINDYTGLINRPPEVVRNAVDLEEDLVQMPFVAGPRTSFP